MLNSNLRLWLKLLSPHWTQNAETKIKFESIETTITRVNVHYFLLSVVAPVRWGRRWCTQPPEPRWRKSLEEVTLKMKCLVPSRLVKSLQSDDRPVNRHLVVIQCLLLCVFCRTTCASRDTCDTCPPAAPRLPSQQPSRNYNELKSQRWSLNKLSEYDVNWCWMCSVHYVCSSGLLLLFLMQDKVVWVCRFSS